MNFLSVIVFAGVVFSVAVADTEFSPADPFGVAEYINTEAEKVERGLLACSCNIFNVKKPASDQYTCRKKRRTITHPGVGKFSNKLLCHRRGFPPDSPKKIKTRFFLYRRRRRQHVLGSSRTFINNISPRNPTKFIIHGFRSSARSKWVGDMKDALLNKGDFNVIAVDWSKGAYKGGSFLRLLKYCRARQNIRVVARQIANLLRQIKERHPSFQFSKVHLIGHSLGGQMSGYVGQELSGIGRISALDPAKPDFEGHVRDCRVDKGDAEFVDVIHTNSRFLGIKQRVGHQDFYVNGGYKQPCGKWYKFGLDVNLCSHSLAHKYFTDSVRNGCNSNAYRCRLGTKTCKNIGKRRVSGVRFGYDADAASPSGSYLILTNKKPPYCNPNARP